MPKFRKKPVVIEAVQYTGRNFEDIQSLAAAKVVIDDHNHMRVNVNNNDMVLVEPGDWVIKGTSGEIYPCQPHIFAAVYELVEEE